MPNFTKIFDKPQKEIIKAIAGQKTVFLGGFDAADMSSDHWAKPGLNHVSAHAPRETVRQAIARKHRQIRTVWGCTWMATIVAAALLGYALALDA